MISKCYEVQNEGGFHIRASMKFVDAVRDLDCKVTVFFQGKELDGSSFAQLVHAGIGCGSIIGIDFDGPDEDEAVNQIDNLIYFGFLKMTWMPIDGPHSDDGLFAKIRNSQNQK